MLLHGDGLSVVRAGFGGTEVVAPECGTSADSPVQGNFAEGGYYVAKRGGQFV